MIILGVDPGSRKAGYALIEVEGRKFKYITSGVLRYDKIDEFVDRLGVIYKSCEELVEKYQPHEISIESLIYVKSVTALAKLAQARGAMIAGFMKTHQGKVSEYSPNLIKSSVTGHGHASKEGVEKTLSMIFGPLKFKSNDESDALAIALCHALNRGQVKVKNNNKLAQRKTGGRSLKDVFKDR
jgi:crossover junction endodeoxyribonuclease RuvC